MRAVVQRVKKASVSIDGTRIAEIGKGLLVLVAMGRGDLDKDIDYVVDKIANMRIFEREGKFDLALADVDGEVLVVSNFTLYGEVRKGRRPSFTEALPPVEAESLYDDFVAALSERVPTKAGRFQAMMTVELVNDGPVTIIVDSKKSM
ncbi:MAG: D-aminoacyl-tRNA deacylase [Actinobacteria bacterium]|nr:D-aminoacyl-tRNA deacylase [Actinomycetota bacterium]